MSLALADIRAAANRIAPHVQRTPVLSNAALDHASGAQLFFKCESLQAAGAFKSRGACNAVFALSDAAAAPGVVAHSSGNHGAALARAAQRRGVPCTIVMPHNASVAKVRNVESYGGRVVFCAPSLAAREAACAGLIADSGATLVHPFDDYHVMAGQGTAALELLEEVPELDLILCPVGGGGLICGTAVAAKGVRPTLSVIGVEPALGDDVTQSFRTGRRVAIATPATIADGLRSNVTGERNFPLIQQHVDDFVTVTEAEIVAAMRLAWEALHVVIEPSSAVAFAAVHAEKIAVRGKKVGIILTGGNVDLDKLPWLHS
ncbi:MAG: threonine/serine dehydratase [Candidatus Didemnitutus sp.]|nr:threonine/serine dehydratase [Candidatus Didemnitutus sp.]